MQQTIIQDDGELTYIKEAISKPQADTWLAELLAQTPWQQDSIRLFGKLQSIPRMQAWYGDSGCCYRYSGLLLEPLPWTPLLQSIKAWIEQHAGCDFNAVMLNCYRDGQDSMGWHSDDEAELGQNPVIASVSLGANRRFSLKRRGRKEQAPVYLEPAHGSLIVMSGALQHHWQHAVPKTRKQLSERVNLTFRRIQSPG